MKSPEVSVIIPTCNKSELLKETVDAVLKQSYNDYEIVIVDNGSKDNTAQIISEYKIINKNIKSVNLKDNLGFAIGFNRGYAASMGIYIVSLNNDAVPDKNWLFELVKTVKSDKKAGMVASLNLFYHDSNIIENSGHLLFADGQNICRHRNKKLDSIVFKGNEVLSPSGSSSLYKREMFDELQGFDEDLYAFGEDFDLALRGWLMGWKALFSKDAVVKHKYSSTLGKYAKEKIFFIERNRILVSLKILPVSNLIIMPFFNLLRLSGYLLLLFNKQGTLSKTENSLSIFKTILSARFNSLYYLFSCYKKRRILYKDKKIDINSFKKLLKKHKASLREILSI